MHHKFIPYEKYKDVPLPWLDKLPETWEVKRAKALYSKVNRPVKDTDEVITCFRDGVVTLRKNRRTTGFTESIKEVGYQGIKKGDLVIHVMDAFAGAVGVSDSDGKSTPVYSVCVPKVDLNNHYYAYIVREMAKTGFIQSLYRGIRERSSDFRFEVFANQYLPIPTREEQDQIVKYLDYKLAIINKFITAKKKLIIVLKEQKQAVINEAVTKGLTSNVKMKPSGIEWLGDIPEHWGIKPLRQLLRPVSIKNRPDLPLLSVVREKGVILRSSMSKEENHNFIPDDLSGYKVVRTGQFAMNKMKAWQGSYGVSHYNGIVSPAYYIFDLNFENKDYFHYAIRSKVYVNFFYQASDGIRVGQWDLSLAKMKEIPFFVPPEDEQKEILEFIPKEFKRIDDAVERLQREINLFEEYRGRLISDVVTGKVDVRNIEIGDFQYEEQEDIIDEEILELEEV
ncbi:MULTISPECIES: restriction endonuclease subunit S [unclassified Exiguobacterium]|uniref:restriction endonuclease subunit S n=1 Tax=unclassified Exiguobacterium TaxID=2644629 RepID=UPI001BECBD83|nr:MULTISPECIES: restriction endonuclease subunit S [unclassified Exiguobacterium]